MCCRFNNVDLSVMINGKEDDEILTNLSIEVLSNPKYLVLFIKLDLFLLHENI